MIHFSRTTTLLLVGALAGLPAAYLIRREVRRIHRQSLAAQPLTADAARARARLLAASFEDWDKHAHVEIESGENSAAGGAAFYSDVSPRGDMWLMRQRSSAGSWFRYGILVQNGRVYYQRLLPRSDLLGAECAECHPNGPRALRGVLRTGTEAQRDVMNVAVAKMGRLDPNYTPTEPAPAAAANYLKHEPCSACHDGVNRARLSRFNRRAIIFQVEHGFMPPDGAITQPERHALVSWLQPRPIADWLGWN